MTTRTTLFCACGAVLVAAPSALAVHFNVTEIGTLGGPSSSALALNNEGVVVGWANASSAPDTPRAIRWQSGAIIDLGTLGGPSAIAFDINDAGQITGYAETRDSIQFNETTHAVIWHNGVMTDLGTTGGQSSRGWAISADGTVVGTSMICWVDPKTPNDPCYPVGNEYAAVWQEDSSEDLGGLFGSSDSSALGVNSSGAIVGQSITVIGFSQPRHATLWRNGQVFDLGTLGGAASWAFDVNEAGIATGFSDNPSNTAHKAFIYDLGTEGPMIDIGVPPGYSNSLGHGINSAGHVVGETYGCCNSAAFWYDGNAMHDLNDLIPPGSGWELTIALDINDAGAIVGSGLHNGAERGFLLTPAAPPCPGDFDGSDDVGFGDLTALLLHWGTCGATCPWDLDGSGNVGFGDLTELLIAWGECP